MTGVQTCALPISFRFKGIKASDGSVAPACYAINLPPSRPSFPSGQCNDGARLTGADTDADAERMGKTSHHSKAKNTFITLE